MSYIVTNTNDPTNSPRFATRQEAVAYQKSHNLYGEILERPEPMNARLANGEVAWVQPAWSQKAPPDAPGGGPGKNPRQTREADA